LKIGNIPIRDVNRVPCSAVLENFTLYRPRQVTLKILSHASSVYRMGRGEFSFSGS